MPANWEATKVRVAKARGPNVNFMHWTATSETKGTRAQKTFHQENATSSMSTLKYQPTRISVLHRCHVRAQNTGMQICYGVSVEAFAC
jgi:hypothetical protein